jgi:hypothetical protein
MIPSRSKGRLRPFLLRVFLLAVYALVFWLLFTSAGVGFDWFLFASISLILLAPLWLFFFAQFVLPVTTITDRLRAFWRFFLYNIGLHGPAVFVKDGEVIQHFGEDRAPFPGVVWLDSASAAVLRKPEQFTRAIGPGITFTRWKERLGGTVDLHLQTATIGPQTTENPFAEWRKDEPIDLFEERQRNRDLTRAITRDGIEIVPTLAVTFRVATRPGEGGTGFGYNPEVVRRAVIRRTNDLTHPDENTPLPLWKRLPTLLAADVWKELVACYTLENLFPLSPEQPSALEGIRKAILARLTEPEVEALDEYGRPQANQPLVPSPEFKLLQDRGLEVQDVFITGLSLPPTVETQLIHRWKGSWSGFVRQQQDLIDQERGNQTQLGRLEALNQLTLSACQRLIAADEAAQLGPVAAIPNLATGQPTPCRELTPAEIVAALLTGCQDLYNSESVLHAGSQVQFDRFRELLAWVESQVPPEVR